MQWGECILYTLQRMYMFDDKNDISSLAEARENADFATHISAMPHIANEGMYYIASKGEGIVKIAEFAQISFRNLLGDAYTNYRFLGKEGEKLELKAQGAQSYCFCTSGSGKATVYSGMIPIKEIEFSGTGVYRGMTGMEPENETRIVFESEFPFMIRSIALYAEKFERDEDVPEHRAERRHNLTKEIPGFYRLLPGGINPAGIARFEGVDTLVLAHDDENIYQITYKAHPTKITYETPDEEMLDMPEEMAAILPLYIAAALYKDTDVQIATLWRNEFETALAELVQTTRRTNMKFQTVTGWWGR